MQHRVDVAGPPAMADLPYRVKSYSDITTFIQIIRSYQRAIYQK